MPFSQCACGAWIRSPGEIQAGRCTACQRGGSKPRNADPVIWSFQEVVPAPRMTGRRRRTPLEPGRPPARTRHHGLPASCSTVAQKLLAQGIQPQDVALAVQVYAAMQAGAGPVTVTISPD